jgi:hypothetical protein
MEDLRIEKMDQQSAREIADRWKYGGEYAFYDMTADPEDYAEITSPEQRGERYFSVFSGSALAGFFCVERAGFERTGTARVSTNGGIYEFVMMERRRGA